MVHHVIIYSRDGCHLCEDAKAKVVKLQNEFDLAIEEVDITRDAELLEEYRHVIPVVVIDSETELRAKITEYALRKALLRTEGAPR